MAGGLEMILVLGRPCCCGTVISVCIINAAAPTIDFLSSLVYFVPVEGSFRCSCVTHKGCLARCAPLYESTTQTMPGPDGMASFRPARTGSLQLVLILARRCRLGLGTESKLSLAMDVFHCHHPSEICCSSTIPKHEGFAKSIMKNSSPNFC